MHDWQSLSHVRWDCKYHVVIVPKYRKKKLYGKFRQRVGEIISDLCRQRGVELIEGHSMPDHIHMCLSVPPKFSIAFVIGFLKGKSAVLIHRKLLKNESVALDCISGPEDIVSVLWGWMKKPYANISVNRKRLKKTSWILTILNNSQPLKGLS